MDFYGSTLSYPFRPDPQAGTLAVVSGPEQIVAQSIVAIMRTMKWECLDLPRAGLNHKVFEIVGLSFAVRTAYEVVQQIKDYEPLAEQVRAEVWTSASPFSFMSGRVAIAIFFKVRGTNSELNMVFPAWDLRKEVKRLG